MKSHHWLLEALLRDCGVQCSVPPQEIERDLRTISTRVKAEGLSFLTITLPSFDSAFLRALSDGRFPSTGIPGFKNSGGLPAFLRGFLRKVFSARGDLLDNPCPTAVACIHQVALTFKKVEAPCSDARIRAAMEAYIETDRSLPDLPTVGRLPVPGKELTAPSLDTLANVFRLAFWEALHPLDRKIWEGEPLNAKHGPGATAERVKANDKFRWTQWTDRLSEVFSPDQYLHAMEYSLDEAPDGSIVPLATVAPELETPVRVIHVPKTMKTPRIIAIEPVSMQFMQQGLLDGITKGIKTSFIGASCLFDDQSVNAKRALDGSRNGLNATLDLSEASDRVGFRLVEHLVRPWFPSLMGALDATRSRKAQVPVGDPMGSNSLCTHCATTRLSKRDEKTPHGAGLLHRRSASFASCSESTDSLQRGHRGALGTRARATNGCQCTCITLLGLRKFASMGSAVCFPVEAMVFTSIALTAVAECRGLPLSYRTIRHLSESVSVFGDDIIVPVDCAPLVADYLEAYGLKVNRRKSFWSGNFRESCGTDAFKGVDVTPAYLKTLRWGDRSALEWLARWVEFSNTLYFKGFWETSRIIRKRIADSGFRIPMVSVTSPAIGFHNVRGTYQVDSWDSSLHSFRVKAYSYRSKRVDSPLDGVAALRKCLGAMKTGPRYFNSEPTFRDPLHLLSAPSRSSSVSTKKRWHSPY